MAIFLKTIRPASIAGLLFTAGCLNVGSIGAIGSNIAGDANAKAGVNASVDAKTDVKVDANVSQNQQSVSNGAQPTPPPDHTLSSRATIHGVVSDQHGNRVTGATVIGRVADGQDGTFANGSRELRTSTQVGSYALNGAPVGYTIELTVSGPAGSATRSIVPLANLEGDINKNRLDFIITESNTNTTTPIPSPSPSQGPALAVESTVPSANRTNVDPLTSFTLTFSKPVNSADVEDKFAIYVAGNPGSSYPLSAGASLPVAYNDVSHTVTGSPILDASAFSFHWSNNNQTLTATFRPGYQLPTDRDPARIPLYAVSFKGAIRDAVGTPAASGWFPGGKNGITFRVMADTVAPRLIAATAIVGPPGQLRAQFSETMVLHLSNGVTIPAQGPQQAINAGQYIYRRMVPAAGAPNGAILLPDGPTAATLWDNDATKSTISLSTLSSFNSGETIWLDANPAIMDPAGNPIESEGGANSKSARAI